MQLAIRISKIAPLRHALDDTTVIVESDSVSDAIALMNLELIKLNIWLQANKLTLNTTKTHYMVFDRGKKQSGNNLLTLNNKSIGYENLPNFSVLSLMNN